jgi:hypothetical protein
MNTDEMHVGFCENGADQDKFSQAPSNCFDGAQGAGDIL